MTNEGGVEIARSLLREKLSGHAEVLTRIEGSHRARAEVSGWLRVLEDATSLDELVAAEGAAAAAYWGGWSAVPVRFSRSDADRVPGYWLTFGHRTSPFTKGPRSSINPANSLLNYCYAIAEAEARIACLAFGLDPGLGIVHADARARDSLALDVVEAVRPQVDAFVLELLQTRTFKAREFHETRQGVCRILAPLTHIFAQGALSWTPRLRDVARRVAGMLAESPGSKIWRLPVGRGRGRNRGHSIGSRPGADPALCRICGEAPALPGKTHCAGCKGLGAFQAWQESGPAAIAQLRATGRDPTHGGVAGTKRGASVSRRLRQNSEWERGAEMLDRRLFEQEILPRLQGVPLSKLMESTGLSLRYCSLIRRGLRVPHPRHWGALRGQTDPQ
jgi:hypothetical protein